MGPWHIEGYAGCGAYGLVFRARRAGHPSSRPVALKVAQCAEDPRFAREAGLLGGVQHPSLPGLLDRGCWTSSTGARHPYVVMEWIRGQTLYEWGRRYNPTNRQVMKVVAQLAWGLEVVHRAQGLHRDVRGDNIQVEPEGRAVLLDFGSCTWRGARPLTERVMPPNTREYRSPEALHFEWEHGHNREARYEARAEDDLYALSVSMYRLLTGEYPPPEVPREMLEDSPYAPPPVRVPIQKLNPRVARELVELVERGLAKDPHARGRAKELAQAADSAAQHAGPEADVPLFEVKAAARGAPATQAPKARPAPVSGRYLPWFRTVRAAFAGATAFACIALCRSGDSPYEPQEVAWVAAQDEALDGGTRGLGEEVLSTRVDTHELAAPSASAITQDMPDELLPGQRRPPCPRGSEVGINGGCWKHQPDIKPPCGDPDYYEWRGACYLPVMKRARVPTTQEP